uniref:DML3 n=1 Tax=Arundo donax TaxID=35708 RepID=A0A0A9CM86_ARUDO
MKDKVMKKVKVTPKDSTPGKVKKKKTKKMQEDGSELVGTSSSNIARQKLDLDSSESKTRFSKATLMANLRSLAKSRGLRDVPNARMRSKRGKKRKHMMFKHQESGVLAMVPYRSTATDASSSALVPLAGYTQLDIVRKGNHGKGLQTFVLGLDDKALQVYDVLRKWDEGYSESLEGFDIGSGPDWEKERHMYEKCVDAFITTMYDLLGPRKFSQWEGSVMDSVVGTFLTQNVADHLSSNAFMNLAAKFPPSKRCCKSEGCSILSPLVDGVDENLNSNEASGIVDSVSSVFNEHVDSEEEVGCDKEIKGHYGQEYKTVMENFIASMKQKDISTWDNELMNMVKDKSGNPICAERTLRKFIATLQPKKYIWLGHVTGGSI